MTDAQFYHLNRQSILTGDFDVKFSQSARLTLLGAVDIKLSQNTRHIFYSPAGNPTVHQVCRLVLQNNIVGDKSLLFSQSCRLVLYAYAHDILVDAALIGTGTMTANAGVYTYVSADLFGGATTNANSGIIGNISSIIPVSANLIGTATLDAIVTDFNINAYLIGTGTLTADATLLLDNTKKTRSGHLRYPSKIHHQIPNYVYSDIYYVAADLVASGQLQGTALGGVGTMSASANLVGTAKLKPKANNIFVSFSNLSGSAVISADATIV